MKKVRIFDNTFTGFTKSASLREENKDVSPTHFEWVGGSNIGDNVFFTDYWVRVQNGFGKDPIAWLIEPRCLRPENYRAIEIKHHLFKAVLTYDQHLLDTLPNARFYPLGGSSIAFSKWGIYPKTRDICMFYSGKDTTEGHKLRKQIVEKFGDRIDVYGAGVGRPVDSKFEVLKDYRYCVVVESCFLNHYFSEKLIDPISVGTIPLYCGSKRRWFFRERKMVSLDFDNLEELASLIKYADDQYWISRKRLGKLQIALGNANELAICENWIYNEYQYLFQE